MEIKIYYDENTDEFIAVTELGDELVRDVDAGVLLEKLEDYVWHLNTYTPPLE